MRFIAAITFTFLILSTAAHAYPRGTEGCGLEAGDALLLNWFNGNASLRTVERNVSRKRAQLQGECGRLLNREEAAAVSFTAAACIELDPTTKAIVDGFNGQARGLGDLIGEYFCEAEAYNIALNLGIRHGSLANELARKVGM